MKNVFVHTSAYISAVGSYIPERSLTNTDLEQMIDTNDEWIMQRTGIRERRIAAENEFCSDLCIAAVRNLVEQSGKEIHDVDYILVATTTPDTFFPSVASRVQAKFGITGCGTTDINTACSGFVSGLQFASGLIASGAFRKILVIGAETLSKITDYTDRTTCILFGDGAGAVLVEADSSQDTPSFLSTLSLTDGADGHQLYLSNLSASIGGHPIQTHDKLFQNGRAVYRWAVSRVPEGILELLALSGTSVDKIDWFIPHNPNMRMLESVCDKTGIPLEKTVTTLLNTGNTSAASIPIALHTALMDGRIKKDNLILLYGFGGGLAQSGLILRWAI